MKKLSIIIPVYYNQNSLQILFSKIHEIEEKINKKGLSLELIFVDDGSGDSSFIELLKIKKIRPQTKIIKHSKNFGAVKTVKTGLHYVTGDCFTMLAADLQDPPELILKMADIWISGEKFIICERESRNDPFFSKIFSFIYYKLIRSFVVKDFPRGGYDLSMMDKLFLPYLLQSGKNINISLFAYSLGFTPYVLYYDRQKRYDGKSRWTIRKRINYFIDTLIGFSIIPIRIISIIGSLIAFLSFIYGLLVIITTITKGIDVPGFSALATLLSFLAGLILIMLGIIGEYIWRIFDQINGSPNAVIEKELLD